MAKKIEELFEVVYGREMFIQSVTITARNRGVGHLFGSNMFEETLDVTTEQMRTIAKFLNETADRIDNDPDFNGKKL